MGQEIREGLEILEVLQKVEAEVVGEDLFEEEEVEAVDMVEEEEVSRIEAKIGNVLAVDSRTSLIESNVTDVSRTSLRPSSLHSQTPLKTQGMRLRG